MGHMGPIIKRWVDAENASTHIFILSKRLAPNGKGSDRNDPDKKVLWALRDWTNLGGCTAVQLLDEPGKAENGACKGNDGFFLPNTKGTEGTELSSIF